MGGVRRGFLQVIQPVRPNIYTPAETPSVCSSRRQEALIDRAPTWQRNMEPSSKKLIVQAVGVLIFVSRDWRPFFGRLSIFVPDFSFHIVQVLLGHKLRRV